MDTILMNSENSKISEPYRLLLNFVDIINLKRTHNYVALSTLSMYYDGKIWESHKKQQIQNISSNMG